MITILTGAIQTLAAPVNIAESETELEARAGKTSSNMQIDPVAGIKQSANPKDWPTTAQIKKALILPKNRARYSYSNGEGLGRGVQVKRISWQ